VLFAQSEGRGGVGVDDSLHVGVGVVSILSASHPNVTGQNVFRRAVRQTRKQKLLLPAVGKRPKKELVTAFVVALLIGSNKEVTHKNVFRIGNVEVIFSRVE
jgi:hypothetical protein